MNRVTRNLVLILFVLACLPSFLPAADLKAPWVVGNLDRWYVENGVLRCLTTTTGDPRHVWVEQDFGSNYTVKCDVRILGWVDEDASRAGVSVRINPNDLQRGLNLLLHNDTNSVDFLNDGTAWGPAGDYAWTINTWYTMELTANGNKLTGTVYPKGSAPSSGITQEWEDERNGARAPGFPGLAAPNNAARLVEYDNFQVLVNGSVAFSDDFGPNVEPERTPFAAPWVTGTNGAWYLENGYAVCNADVSGDPRHVWVDQEFGDGDYTVQCDVRMLNWFDADHARSGIAVRINPDDTERGLNLLFHNDRGSVDMLNDNVAWGTSGEFAWQVGAWYTMTLKAEGDILTGSIVEKGGSNPYSITWDDASDRNLARSPGFPGLTGSTAPGLVAQYDNFKVLVDNQIVFEDDFGANVDPVWTISREIPGVAWTLGQTISNITLTVHIADGQTLDSLTVTEIIPEGLNAQSLVASAGDASYSDGKITWILSNLSADATLTYAVKAPTSEGVNNLVWKGDAMGSDGNETPLDGFFGYLFAGDSSLPYFVFNISETFSYPTNDNDNSLDGQTVVGRSGGFGWGSNAWTALGTSESVVFDVATLDAGIVQSQPTEMNPGNYSAKLTGNVSKGLSRKIPLPVTAGEMWVSFTYIEDGAASVASGMIIANSQGEPKVLAGKPASASSCGIASLADGEFAISSAPSNQANHLLVRIVVAGENSEIFLWINPNKEDRMDSYDAMCTSSIDDLAEIRLHRTGTSGTARYDNIWLSTVPALPPAGAGRVDLKIDDPNRPAELPAWDVISIDQIDDAEIHTWGFGHDNGETNFLIVSGNIYFPDLNDLYQQIVAFGLPVDHMSGLNGHILGPFNFAIEEDLKNCIKFENNDEQRGPFTFEMVPPGNYSELRSAQTVGNGDGQLFCTLNYEDGSTEETFLHADDWYNDGSEVRFANTRLLVDGMNRLTGDDNSFDARFDPAMFECIIPVDVNKVLVSVTLEFDPSITATAAYNLFDIWAVPLGSVDPGVEDWQLF